MSSLISKPSQPRKRPLQQAVQARLAKQKAVGDGGGWGDPSKATRTPRILCIDDDPEICRTLEMRLSDYQAEVLVAYFGADPRDCFDGDA